MHSKLIEAFRGKTKAEEIISFIEKGAPGWFGRQRAGVFDVSITTGNTFFHELVESNLFAQVLPSLRAALSNAEFLAREKLPAHIDDIEAFLSKKISVSGTRSHLTPLDLAVIRSNANEAEALLEAGASKSISDQAFKIILRSPEISSDFFVNCVQKNLIAIFKAICSQEHSRNFAEFFSSGALANCIKTIKKNPYKNQEIFKLLFKTLPGSIDMHEEDATEQDLTAQLLSSDAYYNASPTERVPMLDQRALEILGIKNKAALNPKVDHEKPVSAAAASDDYARDLDSAPKFSAPASKSARKPLGELSANKSEDSQTKKVVDIGKIKQVFDEMSKYIITKRVNEGDTLSNILSFVEKYDNSAIETLHKKTQMTGEDLFANLFLAYGSEEVYAKGLKYSKMGTLLDKIIKYQPAHIKHDSVILSKAVSIKTAGAALEERPIINFLLDRCHNVIKLLSKSPELIEKDMPGYLRCLEFAIKDKGYLKTLKTQKDFTSLFNLIKKLNEEGSMINFDPIVKDSITQAVSLNYVTSGFDDNTTSYSNASSKTSASTMTSKSLITSLTRKSMVSQLSVMLKQQKVVDTNAFDKALEQLNKALATLSPESSISKAQEEGAAAVSRDENLNPHLHFMKGGHVSAPAYGYHNQENMVPLGEMTEETDDV